ncbi:hypothetical protein [Rhizobium sp. SGZ-381]|uniref:hypothetical protein n=1 Tax=Rhizobium sp. SGZ-381 TaxID=3342800 RepID=UPI003670493E
MDMIKNVYLTEDEDILATCAVGVHRPTLRVHMPFGQSYDTLSDIERAVLWAFERVVQTELAGIGRAWIFRGLSYSEPDLEDLKNPLVMHVRALESVLFAPDYEELVGSADTVDHGWARFVEVTEAWAQDILAAA